MPSPVIQLGLKFRKDSEEQKNKDKVMPTPSEDLVLQVRWCCLNLSKAGTTSWEITNLKLNLILIKFNFNSLLT